MAMPLVGRFFRTMGVLPAAEDSIATALAAGRGVALWPGGEVDSLRPWTKREPADPPYLVPLSFDWDGEALLVATPTDSPTGRNLAATRAVRLGLGGGPAQQMETR